MAEIHVVYNLSEKGVHRALEDGINASKLQVIRLLSPGAEVPRPPDPAKVQAAAQQVAKLAESQVTFEEALRILAVILNEAAAAMRPAADPPGVTIEQADEALWALAVSMAELQPTGIPVVRVRVDHHLGHQILRYRISSSSTYSRCVAEPELQHGQLDALAKASEILPAERDRRAELEVNRQAVLEEARAQQEAREALRRIEVRTRAFADLTSALSECEAYPHLSAVKDLRAMVDAGLEALPSTNDVYNCITAMRSAIKEERGREKEQEVLDWVHAHGSENLRLRFDTGYPDSNCYMKERVTKECPGWTLLTVGTDAVCNPSDESLRLLVEARKSRPDAILRQVTAGSPSVVAISTYLGWQIMYMGHSK